MNIEAFEELVEEAMTELPQEIAAQLENVAIIVQNHPRPDQDPHRTGLLGLYEGVSLLDRGADYGAVLPDTITVFRLPHLHLGLDRDDLREEIRRTVLHEVAHHLGIDDDRLHELGWD